MFTVMIIPADAQQPITSSDYDKEPDLDFLQQAVGGYIQQVPRWRDYMGMTADVFCNEDGKAEHLPINVRATLLWYAKLGIAEPTRVPDPRVGDFLVGNIVLMIHNGLDSAESDDEEESS